MTVSAPHRSAQRSFSTSSSVPLDTGDAPMFAFTFVRLARPMHIGSNFAERWLMFAGITIRPAATSSRTTSAPRPGNNASKCGSRSATRRICGVTMPSRANSSCVTGLNPRGWTTTRNSPRAVRNRTCLLASPRQHEHAGVPAGPSPAGAASASGTCGFPLATRPSQRVPGGSAPGSPALTLQPSGRKSHAVRSLGAGMPGVSGLANMRGPPTSGARANDPGVVTLGEEPGLRAP